MAWCYGAGNERSCRFGNFGEKSSGFRVWRFYMVGWPAGIPFWALWRLILAVGQIWLKFLTGIGFFSAPTVKDDISEISVKFRRNFNPCSPQLQKRKAS